MFGSVPHFSHVGHLAKIIIATNASPEAHIYRRGQNQLEAKINFSLFSLKQFCGVLFTYINAAAAKNAFLSGR